MLELVYGLKLREALALPSWEFRAKVEYAHKHVARQALELYQVVSVGSWGDKESRGEYLKEMKARAGYGDNRKDNPRVKLPTQEELRAKVDKFFMVSGVNIPMAGKLNRST
jgi:hypothetical protein